MSKLSVSGAGMHAKVELDGQDISSALRGLTVRFDAHMAPTAVLNVDIYHAAEIDAKNVTVVLPDATAELLTRLGWTPPNSHPNEPQKGSDER
jgi:hypothetical protein